MNHIDALIAQHCPAGVKQQPLSFVAAYSSTRVASEKLTVDTFVGVANLLPDKGGRTRALHSANSNAVARFEEGDVLIGNIRPYLKKIWLADKAGGCSGDVLAVRVKKSCQSLLMPEYLYYVLSSDKFFLYNMRHAKGGKMPRGSRAAILQYQIQLPPIAVQHAIVEILDRFAELEAALEAELEARQRQYAYYLDKAFNYAAGGSDTLIAELGPDGVECKALGDVGRFIRGSGLQKKNFRDKGVGCIHYGQIHTHYGTSTSETLSFVSPKFAESARMAEKGDLIIATTSEDDNDVGKATAWLGCSKIAVSSDACIYRHSLNPKYVAYFFQSSQFAKQKRPHITGTKVRRISPARLAKIRIPVPSMKEQGLIADVLDKFDALVNDLSSGIPAEIEARRKQYEYYRDKLLTFEELRT